MSLPITSENNNKEREPSLSISPPLTLPQMHEMRMKKDKYLEQFNFSHCEDANKYVLIAKIGQGTFGEVFKARSKKNPSLIVAMKKIMMECERNGFPMTALREIRILQQLRHHNIVRLLEICQTKGNKFSVSHSAFFLIFEFCEHDLFGLLSNINLKFDIGIIKNIIQQILNGLHFIHTNMILHRDLKPANILITKAGVLKLADFGLARAFSVKKSVHFKRKEKKPWRKDTEKSHKKKKSRKKKSKEKKPN